MGNTKVGTISLDMVLNNAQFQKSLSEIQTQANLTSTKISSSFKKIGATIAAAFSTAVITSFAKSCIDLGSDLSEVQNVVDVTFTAMSGKVDEWAKNASKSFGLSETMAKRYVGAFGSMADSFGFTEQESYDMATALTGLAGDMASFYNITHDEAYTKLKSVFSGETETLKDLGIVMTQSALDAYALANGYGKTTSAMTEAEKVSLRFAFVQGQFKNAAGDFVRTQDDWANQTRVLQLRFDSLKATLGQGLINVFAPVLKVVNSLIERLTTVSEKFKALTEQFFGNADTSSAGGMSLAMEDGVNSAESLAGEANSSASALDSVAESAEKAKRSVAGFDKLNILTKDDTENTSDSLNQKTQTQSSGSGAVSALEKSVDNFTNAWNVKGKKVIDSIKNAFGNVKDAVVAIGKSWVNVWNNGTGEKVVENIKRLLTNCFDVIGDIAGAFTRAWNKGNLGNEVVQSIIDRWNSLIDLINVIGEDFRKVWNDGVGERIWTNILNIIKNCNEFTAKLREKIKSAWEKNETGERIWGTILGIVEDITGFLNDMSQIRLEWLESLDLSPVVTAVANLGEAFRELLKACGDKLKSAYKNILLPLAKWAIEDAVPKIVEMLAEALGALSKVVKGLKKETLSSIAGAITAIGTSLIIFKTGTAIASGINQIKNAMQKFVGVISAHPIAAVVTGVSAAIAGLVAAIKASNEQKWKDLGFDEVSTDMQNAVDKINSCKDEINGMCESIGTSLSNTSAEMGVIDNYRDQLDELLSKANLTPEEQAELVTIGDYFSEKYPDFKIAWDEYIKKDNNGKIVLTENAEEIMGKLDELIQKYKQVAASNALSNLMQENTESMIKSQQKVEESAIAYKQAQEKFDDFKNEWNFSEDDLNYPDFYTWQNKGATQNATVGDLKKQYKDLKSKLDEAASSYDDACESTAQLAVNNEDLSRMQAVVNGNYEDASAVLMAYNASLITSDDIANSKWKTLDNLSLKAEETAEKTGTNIVFGMNNGVDKYKEQVKKKGLETAELYLNSLNGKEGLDEHSPSKKTYESGVYAVLGLVNGVSRTLGKVKSVFKVMIDEIKKQLSPITSVFSNIFKGIWTVIKDPLNILMSNLESFINGFISAINAVSSGIDFAISSVGQIFGQEWHVGQLDKVKLPRFAKGAIVKAPTLAVVGDNPGASSGDPEVISPLSKLQGMIDCTSSSQDATILSEMLVYLKRLYEMFVIFKNQGGNSYEFVAKINGSEIFDEIIKQNELYKKRHGGKSAFA